MLIAFRKDFEYLLFFQMGKFKLKNLRKAVYNEQQLKFFLEKIREKDAKHTTQKPSG